ncbi:MAG TPA: hypothetical protein VJ481_03080 [Patescibacteria group bacterium]|uniref:Uncharacterized protein n=1 Tax=Candidatus Woesebacteria bacterium RBG_13_46_13 TaxID=1802479 RepID=A0A1F7X4S6_9BACT|nr:MAG: hypothetical protein A2Y68_01110 [Candidatus Woesebacteria bacterium RBG_13_46_13]HJX59512.1 hypothetical protein [Patescibacteria group bacterium]
MTPAQRRKRITKFGKKGKRGGFLRFLLPLLVVLAVLVFVVFNSRYFSGKNKLGIAINSPDGGIIVSVLDPENDEITNISVPASTQLDVARGLGRWKSKSIWALGVNEKIGGVLLQETVIKNFHFPVSAWADAPASGFVSGDFLGGLRAIFFPYKTNLKIGDRVRIGLFAMAVKNANRLDIDLTKTGFIRKAKLTDGESGYIVAGKIPDDLLVVFSQLGSSGKELKVNIKDATGTPLTAQELGETIQVLGGKIVAVSKVIPEASDCSLKGDMLWVRTLSQVFSCRVEKAPPEGKFDLEITIGKAFADRF